MMPSWGENHDGELPPVPLHTPHTLHIILSLAFASTDDDLRGRDGTTDAPTRDVASMPSQFACTFLLSSVTVCQSIVYNRVPSAGSEGTVGAMRMYHCIRSSAHRGWVASRRVEQAGRTSSSVAPGDRQEKEILGLLGLSRTCLVACLVAAGRRQTPQAAACSCSCRALSGRKPASYTAVFSRPPGGRWCATAKQLFSR
jgi:hypothetical protein